MILINGDRYTYNKFPNGETALPKLIFKQDKVVITWKFEEDGELFIIQSLADFFRRKNVERLELMMPYVPYSRMDRESDSYLFTLKTFAKMINAMDFDVVKTYEVHSDVSLALFDRLENHSVTNKLVNSAKVSKLTYYTLMFPDAGAEKRYASQLAHLPSIVGHKHRDFKTGRIESYEVYPKQDLTGKTVIIVDDLCSAGRTFTSAAAKLKEMGADKVFLCVTHLENTVEKGEVFKTDLIDGVFATDSIYTGQKYDKLHLIQLGERW